MAVASRIELVLIAPLIAWEFWIRPGKTATLRALLRIAGISLVTFLVAAPWYTTHLVGNVRKVITVPLEPAMQREGHPGAGLVDLLRSEGLLAVAVLIVIGLAMRPRPERILAAAMRRDLQFGQQFVTKSQGELNDCHSGVHMPGRPKHA